MKKSESTSRKETPEEELCWLMMCRMTTSHLTSLSLTIEPSRRKSHQTNCMALLRSYC